MRKTLALIAALGLFHPVRGYADTSLGMPGDLITGRMVAELDGNEALDLVTWSRTIQPVRIPPGTDPAAAEFMKNMEGRTIHSAEWMVFSGIPGREPVFSVRLEGTEDPNPRVNAAELRLQFELSSQELELLESGQSLSFLPAGAESRDRQEAGELDLEITRLETLEGAKGFAVAGRFSAMLESGQAISGSFDIDEVSGSRLMQDKAADLAAREAQHAAAEAALAERKSAHDAAATAEAKALEDQRAELARAEAEAQKSHAEKAKAHSEKENELRAREAELTEVMDAMGEVLDAVEKGDVDVQDGKLRMSKWPSFLRRMVAPAAEDAPSAPVMKLIRRFLRLVVRGRSWRRELRGRRFTMMDRG